MSYFVYILECSDKSYYVGCTNNLEKRLKEHNNSKWGAHYTKIRRPVTLRHSEDFRTLLAARRREAEIKGWRREKKERLFTPPNSSINSGQNHRLKQSRKIPRPVRLGSPSSIRSEPAERKDFTCPP